MNTQRISKQFRPLNNKNTKYNQGGMQKPGKSKFQDKWVIHRKVHQAYQALNWAESMSPNTSRKDGKLLHGKRKIHYFMLIKNIIELQSISQIYYLDLKIHRLACFLHTALDNLDLKITNLMTPVEFDSTMHIKFTSKEELYRLLCAIYPSFIIGSRQVWDSSHKFLNGLK